MKEETGNRMECAKKTVDEAIALERSEEKTIAIIGVEHSPTSAANYMYTHTGMKKRKGLFLSHLCAEMEKNGLVYSVIGQIWSFLRHLNPYRICHMHAGKWSGSFQTHFFGFGLDI